MFVVGLSEQSLSSGELSDIVAIPLLIARFIVSGDFGQLGYGKLIQLLYIHLRQYRCSNDGGVS